MAENDETYEEENIGFEEKLDNEEKVSIEDYVEPWIHAVHPFKNKKLLIWDIWIVVFSFAIPAGFLPFYTAYIPPQDENWTSFAFHRLTDFFFLLDIFVHFLVTIFDENDGKWVRDLSKIARIYMCHWGFGFDIAMLIPWDIFSSYLLFPTNDIKLIYRIRILNFIRPLKLLRMESLDRVMRRFETNHGIPSAGITLLSSFVLMLVLSHWGACVWGLLPWINDDTQVSWLKGEGQYGTLQHPYITGLYWSVMTLTSVGYGDVPANSTLERAFAIIFMLLSGAFYAKIVGDIISAKTELELTDNEYYKSIDSLNQFMSESQLERKEQIKFRTYFIKKGKQHIKQDYYRDVMKVMSPGLQAKVVSSYKDKWLDKVPPFRIPPVPRYLCIPEWKEEKNTWEHSAKQEQLEFAAHLLERMKLSSYPAAEVIIHQGEVPNRMYILKKGMVTLRTHHLSYINFAGKVLQPGDVFGEDIILSHGRRYYTVQSLTFVDVAFIERDDLKTVLEEGDYPKMKKQIRRYVIRKALQNKVFSIVRGIKKKKRKLNNLKDEFESHKLKLRISPPAYIKPQNNLSEFILPPDGDYDGVRVLLEYIENQKYNTSARKQSVAKESVAKESVAKESVDRKSVETLPVVKSANEASSIVRISTTSPPIIITTMTTTTTETVPAHEIPKRPPVEQAKGWNNNFCSTARLKQCVSFSKKTKSFPTRANGVPPPHPEEITKLLRTNYSVNTVGDLRELIHNNNERVGWGTIEIPDDWKNEIEAILSSEEMKRKCAENDEKMRLENESKIKKIDAAMVRILKKLESSFDKERIKKGQSQQINQTIDACLRLTSPKKKKKRKKKLIYLFVYSGIF